MLEFCAKHGIVAQTEALDMTAANVDAALAKVEANTARYYTHPCFLAPCCMHVHGLLTHMVTHNRYRMVLVNRDRIPAAASPAVAATASS